MISQRKLDEMSNRMRCEDHPDDEWVLLTIDKLVTEVEKLQGLGRRSLSYLEGMQLGHLDHEDSGLAKDLRTALGNNDELL